MQHAVFTPPSLKSGWQTWEPLDSMGACVWRGHQERVLRCLRNPLDSMEACVWRGHQERIPECSRDPLDSMGACVWRGHQGRIWGCPRNPGSSQDWKDKVRLPEESRKVVGNTGQDCHLCHGQWVYNYCMSVQQGQQNNRRYGGYSPPKSLIKGAKPLASFAHTGYPSDYTLHTSLGH